MITLITGLPGNAKTLYALTIVEAKARKENRPVFYARIKGVQEKGVLQWTLIDPFKWFDCPPNAIIVIDECQKADNPNDPKSPPLFGVRQRGAAVPLWAAKLEDHRHGGVDLFLITQDPMLIDGHDRKLCQQHYHCMRVFGMQRSTIHEFTNGVRDNVHKSRTGSIRHEWSFNKAAYEWYTSSEVHTHKARIPMRVWLLLALPVMLAFVCWFIYVRWQHKLKGDEVPTNARPTMLADGTSYVPPANGKPRTLTRAEYLDVYTPRLQGLAYTAPVYDEVTKPTQAPYPAACVQAKARCQCYSQQGTRLDVPRDLCEGIVAGGFFVAWDKPLQQAVRTEPAGGRLAALPEAGPGYVSLGGARVARVAEPVVSGNVEQSQGRPGVRAVAP